MWLGNSNSDDLERCGFDAEAGTGPRSSIKVDPLLNIGTVFSFARNREIFAQDEPASTLHKVISGAVRTCRHFSDGRRQVGAFYLPGQMFGLELGSKRTFSAEAISCSKILVLKRSTLLALADQQDDLAFRLWDVTAQELRAAQDHVLLLMKTAPERVATFLLGLADRTGKGGSIDLAMSRRDIADYLGLTVETVSRAFSDFQSGGAIELPTSHRVVFQDRTALEKLRD
jgi:CRP/FNR family transcriptional regulator, nitrogen fixation regulation protein